MSLLVLLELVRDKCKVSAKLSYLRISLHAVISEQAGRTWKAPYTFRFDIIRNQDCFLIPWIFTRTLLLFHFSMAQCKTEPTVYGGD